MMVVSECEPESTCTPNDSRAAGVVADVPFRPCDSLESVPFQHPRMERRRSARKVPVFRYDPYNWSQALEFLE